MDHYYNQLKSTNVLDLPSMQHCFQQEWLSRYCLQVLQVVSKILLAVLKWLSALRSEGVTIVIYFNLELSLKLFTTNIG